MANILAPVVHAALGITLGVTQPKDVLEQYKRVEEYQAILENAKQILRQKMFDLADSAGEKDEKGSSFMVLPDGTGWKKEIRRPAPKVDKERALELLKSKRLTHRISIVKEIDEEKKERVISILEQTAPEFVVTKEVVEDSDLEQAFIQGEITDNELREVVDMGTPTYALKKIQPK